jgi:hypothetical protein
LTREEYYETFIKLQIKNLEHLNVFLKATLKEGATWTADDCRWFETMYTMPKVSVNYKTDITMADIMKKDAFTAKPKKKKTKGK